MKGFKFHSSEQQGMSHRVDHFVKFTTSELPCKLNCLNNLSANLPSAVQSKARWEIGAPFKALLDNKVIPIAYRGYKMKQIYLYLSPVPPRDGGEKISFYAPSHRTTIQDIFARYCRLYLIYRKIIKASLCVRRAEQQQQNTKAILINVSILNNYI